MADVFHASDTTRRSVWVVVDPRDAVTGDRVISPLEVRLDDVTATPILGRSGVYCFTDLELAAGPYTVRIRPRGRRDQYLDAARDFVLAAVPVPAQPLNRNLVPVELLPRPSYAFSRGTTLARGRLVTTSDAVGIAGADIDLILDGADEGLRGRTDERGEFVVPFPAAEPGTNAVTGPLDLPFQLRFEVTGQPPHLIAQEVVQEGSTISLDDIAFPGT
jgi:hypothetical protein